MQKIHIFFKSQIQKKVKIHTLIKNKDQIIYFYKVIIFRTYMLAYYYYYK